MALRMVSYPLAVPLPASGPFLWVQVLKLLAESRSLKCTSSDSGESSLVWIGVANVEILHQIRLWVLVKRTAGYVES